jgi:hypothetical protein
VPVGTTQTIYSPLEFGIISKKTGAEHDRVTRDWGNNSRSYDEFAQWFNDDSTCQPPLAVDTLNSS